MAGLVISLDFELFWGVSESRTIAGYAKNIEGVWEAIPKMLELFQRYEIHATWATVGMLMCRGYDQWREIRPSILPGYIRQQCSTYALDPIVREYPKLFFARPLVEQIRSTAGQEIATHTYSHFYCGEEGATPEQFAADLECAHYVTSDLGIEYSSLVFPRNQIKDEFIPILSRYGICSYRGNPDHWLYRNGHHAPGNQVSRALKLLDSYLPISGAQATRPVVAYGVTNVRASHFLRPWTKLLGNLENFRLARLKHAMTEAAESGMICHLWWHPHNFGIHTERNISILESLLLHYLSLKEKYGMQTACLRDLAQKGSL